MKLPNVTCFALTPLILFSPFTLGYDTNPPKTTLKDQRQERTETSTRLHDSQCVLRAVGDKTHRNRHTANACDNGEQTRGSIERNIIADKSRRNLLMQ